MRNVDLRPLRDQTPFRKLGLGIWRTTYDAKIYGWRTIRMEPALEYIERFEKRYGTKLTVTHLVTKAVGEVLRRYPEANALLRFDKIYLREHCDVCLNVAAPDPMTGQVDVLLMKIADADQKSLVQIAADFERQVSRIRAGRDATQQGAGPVVLRHLPGFLMAPLMKFLSFLQYGLNFHARWLGLPRDSFGSVQVTSLGSLGIGDAKALGPLVPFTRMPILVVIGGVHEAPVVEGGEVRVGKVMTLSLTADHRITDGPAALRVVSAFMEIMEDPFEHFDPV